MLKAPSTDQAQQAADRGPPRLRLRILLGGFDSETIQKLRQQAAAFADAELRIFSRRRSDLRPDDSTTGQYDVILLHAGAFGSQTLELEQNLVPLMSGTPVVLAGANGDARYVEALIRLGCEEVLDVEEQDAGVLLNAAVKAAARRSRDEGRELQRAALHSLEQSLGYAPSNDEPILILGDDSCVSFANRAAQELGSATLARLIEQIGRQHGIAPGVLITRVETRDADQRQDFTVTATRLPVQDHGFTILRVKTHRPAHLGDALEQRLSLLDPVTGLPGRSAFLQRMDGLIALAASSGRPSGLLLVQIDQMASVHEALGHETGRALLNLVAQRLRFCLRSDDWLGFLGDNSFAVLAPDPRESTDLGHLADKLRQEIAAAVVFGGERLSVTASIGIASFPDDGRSVSELLHRADLALARARARGGDAYEFFDPELSAQLRRRWELQMALHTALERKQLWIAFQPVMGDQGRICGAEALLRWQHPGLGAQSPDDFVPMLEQSGLIHKVGEWVLRQACEQAQRWRRSSLPDFRMSVNLSPVQLRDPQLAEKVRRALHDSGLAPSGLVLEVTESVLLERTEDTVTRLDALAALGIGLHIDDFGTGFSSIAYLKRLPFTGLKIDRDFVHQVSGDARDQALLRWMVELARVFELDTVAEGVETLADAQVVAALGVSKQQGFLHGEGIAADDFEQRYLKPS